MAQAIILSSKWAEDGQQVTPVRKITRSVHESARDVARDIAKTRLYRQSGKDRKKVEV